MSTTSSPHDEVAGDEVAAMKRAAKVTWAMGDFAAVAHRDLWPVGGWITKRLGIVPGDDVLDVACGTGNAAIRAALAGGHTVGVDLTPELLIMAGELAARAGVEVEWREGDAEALPVDDESFDAVVSTFGAMFAPRHEVTARELVRVLRPGGRMGLCNWPIDGTLSRILRTMGKYLPAPAEAADPPLLWGSEDHVRELFDGIGIDLEFERNLVEVEAYESADANVEFHSIHFGPMIQARRRAQAEGRWEQLRAELVAVTDQTALEYLVVLGRKH